ncbi:MAG: periplasmic heavy metal sensor [Desulfosarcinaceae bacterium]|nr:periplasmic heavy metal sensor [Desulfosarcinaceae bacterium]
MSRWRWLKSAVLFIGLLMVCWIGEVAGQEMMNGRWWNNERVVNRLGLTTGEVAALETAFRNTRRNLIALKGKVEVEQFELETLLESPELDDAAAKAQYQRLETARTALGTERFHFLLEVRRVVGLERFRKLMQFRRLERQRKQTPP